MYNRSSGRQSSTEGNSHLSEMRGRWSRVFSLPILVDIVLAGMLDMATGMPAPMIRREQEAGE